MLTNTAFFVILMRKNLRIEQKLQKMYYILLKTKLVANFSNKTFIDFNNCTIFLHLNGGV
jgi:hypothetical protein